MAIHPSGSIINNRYEVVQGPNEKPSLAGGMGLVYLCVDHEEDGKPVALKTFRPELLSDRAARDRFLREGTTWVELGKHPHIVHCYQVFKVDVGSEVFFALELVAAAEGKRDASLRSWLISQEPLPLEQALLFALHICRGMVHATNMIPGMVHRDLKPENILIGRDGHARVTDFGLVRAAQQTTNSWQPDTTNTSAHIRTQLTQSIAGTPPYMAPEQWMGDSVDVRADIYGFGCILYEMISGTFAVSGKSREELKQSHCRGQLNTIPSHVPSEVNHLVQRCLALNAGDRYPNWTALADELTDIYPTISGKPAPVIQPKAKDTPAERIAVGWSYNAMGLAYQDISKFDVARDYFEKVLSISRQHSDRNLEGAALGNMGEAYRHLGDARCAIKFYEQCLAIAREIDGRQGECITLRNLGEAYRLLGDPRQAIYFYNQSLTITREIGDRHEEGRALGNLGIAYLQLGDPHQAIAFHKQRLTIAREIGDRQGEGNAMGNLGNAYFQLGDVSQAIVFYKHHLNIALELGDRQGEGTARGNLGNTYFQLGDIRKAIDFYKHHLAIAHEIGDRLGESLALGNLGAAYGQLGDPRQSITFYEQLLAIAREIGNRHCESAALSNLGSTYTNLGNPRQAIGFYEQGLAIAHEIGDRQGEGRTLGNLGIAYSHLGNHRRAIGCCEQGLAIAREIGDRQVEGNALRSLGTAYCQLGNVHRAIEFYEQHLFIAREIGDIHGVAITSFNMALLYQHDHPSKALDYAQTACQLFIKMGHGAYAARAQALIDKIRG